jgi:hypothetical protein
MYQLPKSAHPVNIGCPCCHKSQKLIHVPSSGQVMMVGVIMPCPGYSETIRLMMSVSGAVGQKAVMG